MFIRIPGDTANEADYAEEAQSFETLDAALDGLDVSLGTFDRATILDARTHPVRVVATAQGFTTRAGADRAMISATVHDGGTAHASTNTTASVMIWVAD